MVTFSYSNRTISMLGFIMIKTHGHVSVAKKAIWHTSVLFTGIAKFPFLISISTKPNLNIVCPLYTQPYISKLAQMLARYVFLIIAQFSSHFSSLDHFKNNFEPVLELFELNVKEL